MDLLPINVIFYESNKRKTILNYFHFYSRSRFHGRSCFHNCSRFHNYSTLQNCYKHDNAKQRFLQACTTIAKILQDGHFRIAKHFYCNIIIQTFSC